MAVQGAHLTSTVSAESDAPSIFEVLAEESLVHTLRPTLQHLLRILAERNPHRYGFLYRYNEEVYLTLQLILENYYLKHHSASFSENFYGLKRSVIQQNDSLLDVNKLSINTSCSELPQSQHYRSILFLVLVPYMKNKCDAYYEHLSATEASGGDEIPDNKYLNIKKLVCQAFLGAYPILHVAWETTMLAYQMAYIFGKSRFHTPFLKWAGVILQNLTEQDMEHNKSVQSWSFQNKNWKERFLQISSRLLNGLAITLSMGLSVGVFFLQFLEWWYASDQKTKSITALPNPPPPQPLSLSHGTVLHTLCPLCQRVRTNDTVLAVSGFVFCYSCISKYISDNGHCPITKYPATHDHLVRLYLPDT